MALFFVAGRDPVQLRFADLTDEALLHPALRLAITFGPAKGVFKTKKLRSFDVYCFYFR